jgi:nicotinate-nucleotide pyrophosphorylase (carboxylating)
MNAQIKAIVRRALKEDMPEGDITVDNLFTTQTSSARLIAKQDGVVSGIEVAKEVFAQVDPEVLFEAKVGDGQAVQKGDILASVSGSTASLLKAERVALNFLQRMSGIATTTRRYQELCVGTNANIYDTRKTTPGLRMLEKQAVRDGGACNHRLNLSTMAMLKDNHLAAFKSIAQAVAKVRDAIGPDRLIEVEVETVKAFVDAWRTDCDIIMLDNMPVDFIEECVRLNRGRKILEASGNMTLERIPAVAKTGVDMISVGALTHSYSSMDISMRFMELLPGTVEK